MKSEKMGWAGRLLLMLFLALLVVSFGRHADALTGLKVVTSNLSSAASGSPILLHDGEQLTYKDIGSANVGTLVLEKSYDGFNYNAAAVNVSTKNNSGTFTGTVTANSPTRGLVYFRWRQDSYTSGYSSTTLTEVDNLLRQALNSNSESIKDEYEQGVNFPGYAKFAGPAVLGVQTTTQISVLNYPVGSTVWAQESVAGALVTDTYNLCGSTKAEAGCWVYLSKTTSTAAVLGGKCNN